METIHQWAQILVWGFVILVPPPVIAYFFLKWLTDADVRSNMNGGHGPLDILFGGHFFSLIYAASFTGIAFAAVGAVVFAFVWICGKFGATPEDLMEFFSFIQLTDARLTAILVSFFSIFYGGYYGCTVGMDVARAQERIKRGDKFREVRLNSF